MMCGDVLKVSEGKASKEWLDNVEEWPNMEIHQLIHQLTNTLLCWTAQLQTV